ncbi:putative cyclin-dependent serine/threonine-protein kinase DDB_G0272797/DDB_G0274007 [Rhopilema esculentum]|uniref:putative cyclin-dependent serine/threonine-protein kinase DDB_G0272797/DDB_G0274007 n=1 Tax=Rhopilema esculentum TaxID=499914 RepID=UPI0031E1FF2C
MSTIVPYSNEDPEKLFVCPYFKEHVVRACRFNQHIRKCQKIQGGVGYLICPFNRSHHIPEKDYNFHLKNCPDKHVIQQDIDEAQGIKQHTLPAVEHHPEYDKLESTEDWDAEFEHHQLQQRMDQEQQMEEERNAEEEEENLTNIQLLPEHPPNWESMTKAQKTNYKRRYKKQQEKLKEKGLTHADFQKSKNPEDWTEEEREAKINLMLSLYPPPKVTGSFKDYKSVLNQYCQKNRINQPKYYEIPSCFSGFACEVMVNGKTYRSHGHQTNKKTAGHSAAKWALMELEVPEAEQNELNQKLRPARTAEDMAMLRSAHEVGLLQQAGHLPSVSKPSQEMNNHVTKRMQQVKPPVTPQVVSKPSPQPVPEPVPVLIPPSAFTKQTDINGGFASPVASGVDSNDSWQTVGSKKSARSGKGRGRGTALATF